MKATPKTQKKIKSESEESESTKEEPEKEPSVVSDSDEVSSVADSVFSKDEYVFESNVLDTLNEDLTNIDKPVKDLESKNKKEKEIDYDEIGRRRQLGMPTEKQKQLKPPATTAKPKKTPRVAKSDMKLNIKKIKTEKRK